MSLWYNFSVVVSGVIPGAVSEIEYGQEFRRTAASLMAAKE
ncbi:hypothetical protein L21SP2_1177 [Salinispira pacifica]|uniref:Uncharacterized protein n=1 Tax=Salinispira pacifica TaxID=1307761 RepID=V5WG41_9SPIO|nr:hypothetical protein L21SP2_1177 [Salinispira pacifica]